MPFSSENSDSETEVNLEEPPASTPLSELQVALAAMRKQQAEKVEKAMELAKQELQVQTLMQAAEKAKADEEKQARQERRKQKKAREGKAKSQMDGMEEMRLLEQKAPEKAPEKDKVVPRPQQKEVEKLEKVQKPEEKREKTCMDYAGQDLKGKSQA